MLGGQPKHRPDKLTIASTSPSLNSDESSSTATGICGWPGDDNIVGSDLVDLIRGGDGNDTMDGRLGGDGMNGQQGIDTVTYASRPASQPVLVDQRIQGNEEIQAPSGATAAPRGTMLRPRT
jgi:hypothetical protein